MRIKDARLVMDIHNIWLARGDHTDGPGVASVMKHCFNKGVLVRVSGDTLVLSPPLVISAVLHDPWRGC